MYRNQDCAMQSLADRHITRLPRRFSFGRLVEWRSAVSYAGKIDHGPRTQSLFVNNGLPSAPVRFTIFSKSRKAAALISQVAVELGSETPSI